MRHDCGSFLMLKYIKRGKNHLNPLESQHAYTCRCERKIAAHNFIKISSQKIDYATAAQFVY